MTRQAADLAKDCRGEQRSGRTGARWGGNDPVLEERLSSLLPAPTFAAAR